MRLNSIYVQVYAVYLNFLINGILPFALVIILNILIIKELKGLGQDQTLPAPTPGNFSGLFDRMKSLYDYCQLSLINDIMVLYFSENILNRNGSVTTHVHSNRRGKEIAIAKLGLIIAVVFILCHSIKWIPNIHEILMVCIIHKFEIGKILYQNRK